MRRAVRAAAGALGALLAGGCGEAVLGPDPARDPVSVFEAAWGEMDRWYAFFGHFGIDWDAAHARWRPRVSEASGPAELREALCGLVAEARSQHAWLATSLGSCGARVAPYRRNFDPALIALAVPALQRTPSGRISYGRIGGDVAYVRIPSFAGSGWGTEIDGVLAEAEGVRGVVIDLRGNPGGSESVGEEIAGRFVDRERVYRLARFRNGPGRDDFTEAVEYRLSPRGERFAGPVAVLTNRDNASAAEDFLLMMRAVPSAFTVGDTTSGTSSNPIARELPNGWVLRVPQSVQTTPEGEVVEGRGLAPAIAVRLAPADSARGIDTLLRAAVEEVRRR